MISKQELIDFEEDIAECFNNKMIHAPIHLDNGNEDQLINIFTQCNINKDDWVCCTWRSHYRCLLKGVPKDRLKEDILAGRSIGLCYPEYKIISSAIVGGIIPIALGLAYSIKLNSDNSRVFCFVGDMSSETGIFYECAKYTHNFKLPLYLVIEDNEKSVCTPTREIWGNDKLIFEKHEYLNIIYYKYQNKWPHAGSGTRINF